MLFLSGPGSKRADDEKIADEFSQKPAAALAGPGRLGKSCLLISGPRSAGAGVTVLTCAPLAPYGTGLQGVFCMR